LAVSVHESQSRDVIAISFNLADLQRDMDLSSALTGLARLLRLCRSALGRISIYLLPIEW
jgi:hypothetical protein